MEKYNFRDRDCDVRVYSGCYDFDTFRRAVNDDGFQMLTLDGLAGVISGRRVGGLARAVSLNRVFLNTAVLWTPTRVYVRDNPGFDSGGRLVLDDSACDILMGGCTPDKDGVTWFRDTLRCLDYGFFSSDRVSSCSPGEVDGSIVSGDFNRSQFLVNPLAVALAGRIGVRTLADYYLAGGLFTISAYHPSELSGNVLSALSIRGPNQDFGLSINPDSDPNYSGVNSIVVATKKLIPSRRCDPDDSVRRSIPDSRRIEALQPVLV